MHLISLYLVLVRGLGGKAATKKLSEIKLTKPAFQWLEPPSPNGSKTILDVINSKSLNDHEIKVREWAENVFNCWYTKHKKVIDKLVEDVYSSEL